MNNLLLLHGALGVKSQFAELEKKLSSYFNLHSINFTGHGGEPMPYEQFSIKLFANDVLDYLNSSGINKTSIFGYSMGGYVGVYVAKHFPERVNKVFTLGTKFKWDMETASREAKMLDPVKMKEKIPQFYDELVKRHAPHNIEIILQKTADMMMNLGANNELKSEDYSTIQHEIMVGIGDRDKMVTLEETVDVYKKLPKGSSIVLPNTPHPFEEVNSEQLENEIKRFFG
ncbi:MAG TPA: alpha/beta hydrolase [Ignavibacteria bacterium]|nr:alpha/beta hydrolase [Ignavibacteria bacterium]